jgi:hypothetical protein
MNPITSMVYPQDRNKQSIIGIAQGIRNGAVNAKSQCLNMLNSLSREQRRQLASTFPAFAKRQGMKDNDIQAFMQEINI